MFERFTAQSRRTVLLAQEEAQALGHAHIGTEHLLLALLRDDETVAGQALAASGIKLEDVRGEIQRIVPPDEKMPKGHIPFTPRSKKVLELSLRESLRLRHHNIEPEHILLGLLREGEGLACQVLVKFGADLRVVGAEVTKRMWLPEAKRSGFRLTRPQVPAMTRGGVAAWDRAATLAAGRPLGSQHVLLGLFADENSLAARALSTLGVSPKALEDALEKLDPADTSDEPPDRAGARHTRLHVAGDMVTMRVQDADLAARLSNTLLRWRKPSSGEVELSGNEPEVAEPFARLWRAIQTNANEILQRLSTAGSAVAFWKPPSWSTEVSVASYAVWSRPDGLASELFTPEGVDQAQVKEWLATWLSVSAPTKDAACAWFTVVIGRMGDIVPNAVEPEAWTISSFATGADPAPPEWPRRPLADLVAFAATDLQGSGAEPSS